MGELKYNNAQHNKNNNRGAAMIVVVCIMAIVMILSLTLLMTAYQMLATVSDEGRDELYYQQVMSFSKVLKQRLEKNGEPGVAADALVEHINEFMTADAYKDVGKETLEADAPVSDGVYGGITLVLDKESSNRNIVITITVNANGKPMSTCTCKFLTKEEAGTLRYTFDGYY